MGQGLLTFKHPHKEMDHKYGDRKNNQDDNKNLLNHSHYSISGI